jgi:hypothetical protein
MVFEYTRNENGDFVCTHCKDYVVPKGKQSTMNMHYHAKHSGDLPHGCTHCARRFLSRLSLEQHVQTNHMDRTQRAEVAETFSCPIEGCRYTAYTAGNRRIHFLRKHCTNEVNAILERNGDSYTCLECTHVYNSSTAFYYHVAKCLPANTMNLQEIM